MKNTNCTVCGLHKEACLHQMEHKEEKSNQNIIRMLWFGLGFISSWLFYLFSCSTGHFITNYQITDSNNRSYYTNEYEIKNDSISFIENPRNPNVRFPFKIPYKNVKIQVTNRKKNE
ncbi:hypothetical protein [Flavobacterium sp. T12S277]|uniref:hypothetical protein n=1 Tax=Flavobacterium sp. T12S277 TaxID=3402752 RepID=UPI003AE19A20